MIKPGIIVAVDFDGTVVTHEYPKIGKPLPYCIETLKKITAAGGKLILYTMRSGEQLSEAIYYLRKNDVVLWGVNKNHEQESWTSSPKVYAHIYIDDAADLGLYTMQDPNFSSRRYVDWSLVDALLFPEEF